MSCSSVSCLLATVLIGIAKIIIKIPFHNSVRIYKTEALFSSLEKKDVVLIACHCGNTRNGNGVVNIFNFRVFPWQKL